jgi:hypothetical protein
MSWRKTTPAMPGAFAGAACPLENAGSAYPLADTSDKRCNRAHDVIWHGYHTNTSSAARFRPFLDQRCLPTHMLFRGTWPRPHVGHDQGHLNQCFTDVQFTLGVLCTDLARCNLQQKLASSVSHLLLEIFTHFSLLPQSCAAGGPPGVTRQCPFRSESDRRAASPQSVAMCQISCRRAALSACWLISRNIRRYHTGRDSAVWRGDIHGRARSLTKT